jgi:hypothetical protein
MVDAPVELLADDLAPGDAAARAFDWSGLRVARLRTPRHPLFAAAYARLWQEFGPRGEMETEEVIASRLGWVPGRPVNGHALRYEMLLIQRGDAIVALRDHTAIVPCPAQRSGDPGRVIVHLSHVIVEPPLRGSGLAAWLRALPLQTARECARAAGQTPPTRITLVAEMEHPDGVTPMVTARLRSYQRAGFLKVDPDAVQYCQPDFRAAAAIDRSSVQPLPLALLVRRVGAEHEHAMLGAEVRELVSALYTMFGMHARADHMAPLWTLLKDFPDADQPVALRAPLS